MAVLHPMNSIHAYFSVGEGCGAIYCEQPVDTEIVHLERGRQPLVLVLALSRKSISATQRSGLIARDASLCPELADPDYHNSVDRRGRDGRKDTRVKEETGHMGRPPTGYFLIMPGSRCVLIWIV
jgi:hypothetical protein